MRASPPLRGTRSTKDSGPRCVAADNPDCGGDASRPQAGSKSSGARRRIRFKVTGDPKADPSLTTFAQDMQHPSALRAAVLLERRPQRPGPEALLARPVERNRVVPTQDGVVEEVEPETHPIAAQRIPLPGHVVSFGLGQIDILTVRPRGPHGGE